MILDTNAVIYLSKGREDILKYLEENNATPRISRITYVEFLSDPNLNQEEAAQAKQSLKEMFVIEDLT